MQITYKYQDDSTRGKGGDVAFETVSPFVPPAGALVTWPGGEVGMTVAYVQCDYVTGRDGFPVLSKITVWLRK